MYLQMYDFVEKPFHITPNPRFIFLSKNHKEAFAHILYGVQQRVGFLSLTGEVGTGKTTVLRTLLDQLEESAYRVALIFNPCLSAQEMLQTIHREFSIEFDAERTNLGELHESLNRFLLQQREQGTTVVLVVDEAQNLDPKVLEQLRLLSNLETETEKLIQMILVGQPELDAILQRNDLRQLRQRLAVRYQLRPMDAEDTARYVLHRVRVAGCSQASLFGKKSLAQIYRLTKGTPRLINILCDRALLVAYGQDAVSVTKQHIQLAQRELQINSRPRAKTTFAGYALLIAVVVLLAGIKLFSLSSPNPPLLAETQPGTTLPQPLELQAPVPAATKVETVKPPVLSAERIASLRQKVATLTIEESGLSAVMAMAELWQQPLPSQPPSIMTRTGMKKVLRGSGFDLAEINISVAELLRLDAPLILEINLPNVNGKRFIAVTQVRSGQVKIVPELTASGWLDFAELGGIWFGKALLPYVNYLQIPLLARPNQIGSKVTALQQLLHQLDGVDAVSSGIYDKPTIDLVTDFQLQRQLIPDGRVGSYTLYWLYRDTNDGVPRLSAGEGA